MSEHRPWAPTSAEYLRRLAASGQPATSPAPATQLRAAQSELTHVYWDHTAIHFDQISHVGVEKARHRFRASIPDLVWNAAALEGNTFTLPEVRTLLDGTTVDGKRLEEERQILALSEGYSLVDELVGAGAFRVDKQTANRIHGLIARHEAIEAGHFRGEGTATGGGNVRLANGGFVEGVPSDDLADRWDDLISYISDLADPRERALAFNASATRTQYYFDDNKRTARLMMTGELMANGFDSVNIPNSRRLEFNHALDELFTTSDATNLMRFTASCAMR